MTRRAPISKLQRRLESFVARENAKRAAELESMRLTAIALRALVRMLTR